LKLLYKSPKVSRETFKQNNTPSHDKQYHEITGILKANVLCFQNYEKLACNEKQNRLK